MRVDFNTVTELEKAVREQIDFLENHISSTKNGGWSTQGIDAMQKQCDKLKVLLFNLNR
jgi:hypothetical protein